MFLNQHNSKGEGVGILQSLRVLWFNLVTQCTARGFLPLNSFGIMLGSVSS